MKIVIKIGGILFQTLDGRLNKNFINHLAEQVKILHQKGHQIILVSSGAVAAGTIKNKNYSVARAAMAGQVKLMSAYFEAFDRWQIRIGQALYSYYDLEGKHEKYIKEKLLEGFKWKEITIVNANDAVMDQELQALSCLADNDKLAAKLAVLIEADLLMILTDVDGLFRNYKTPQQKLVKKISIVDDKVIQLAQKMKFSIKRGQSKGGMASKIGAAKLATSHGIKTIILNGRMSNALVKGANNSLAVGTTFLVNRKAID